MLKELQTERLFLRKFQRDDCKKLYEILKDPETMTAWEHGFGEEETKEFIEMCLRRYEEDGIGHLAVFLKESKTLVGAVGPIMEEIEGQKHLGLGYIIKRDFWGQGYGKEASIACLDYCFDILNKEEVLVEIRPENEGSLALAKSLGFQKKGQFMKPYKGKELLHYILSLKKQKITQLGVKTTERLMVRHFHKDDLDQFYEIVKDPETMAAWGQEFSKEEAKRYIDFSLKSYQKEGYAYYPIFLKESKTMVGAVGLLLVEINGKKQTELAYFIKREYWGKGYAKEACLACLHFWFDTLKKEEIVAQILPHNEASVKLVQTLGFRQTGEYLRVRQGEKELHFLFVLKGETFHKLFPENCE